MGGIFLSWPYPHSALSVALILLWLSSSPHSIRRDRVISNECGVLFGGRTTCWISESERILQTPENISMQDGNTNLLTDGLLKGLWCAIHKGRKRSEGNKTVKITQNIQIKLYLNWVYFWWLAISTQAWLGLTTFPKMSFLGPVSSAPQSNTEKDADHRLNKFPVLVNLACWRLKGLQPVPHVACPADLLQHHWNSLPCSVTSVSASGVRRWTPQSDGFNRESGWGQTVFPEPRGPSAGRREEEKPLLCSLRFRTAYLAYSPFGHMFIPPFQQTVLWRFTMGSNGSGIFLMFWFPRAVPLARVSLLRLESWIHHRPLFCGKFTQVWPFWGNHGILDSELSAYHLPPVPSPNLVLTVSLEACGMVRGTFYKKVLGLIWGPNRIFCNIQLSFSWCHPRRQNESTRSCTSGLVNIISQHPRAYRHHTLASLQTRGVIPRKPAKR